MTKSFTKRLHRVIAVLMAVAMLVGTLPADLLGGIASVKAGTEASVLGTGDGNDTTDGGDTSVVEIPYTRVYSFVDGSIVTSDMDGKTPAVSMDGKLTVASSASSTFKLNGNQHGVQMANGGTVTIAVDGDCTITVGGCQYNNAASTIELNGEVVQTDTKTAACPNQNDPTADGNAANSFAFDYKGEAGDVVLTFNGTNYVPYIIVSGVIKQEVIKQEYTNVYSFVDGSIVTSDMDGKTPAVSMDGKLTVASSASSTFKLNGNQHGVQMANGGTVTIAVDGDCTITVGGCQYNNAASTIELNGEVVQTDTKTAACPNQNDPTADSNLANSFVFDYEGEAGDVVLTFNGTNYVPYILVSGTKLVAVEDYTSVYSFVDGSIVTSDMDGKTPAVSADGKLTVASSASSTFKLNGNQHGVQMANGGTVTIAVEGDSKITVGGCQYNNAASTIELNGEVVQTDTKTAACPNQNDPTADSNLANSFVFDYKGEAGDVVLTFNGTNYVPYIIVSGKRVVSEDVTATVTLTGTDLLQDGDTVTLTNAADKADVVDVTEGGEFTLKANSTYNVAVSNSDIAASIAGKTMMVTVDADVEVQIDLVATVVHPVVTINDPDSVIGEAEITLTNMNDDTEVHTLVNGESVKLKIGASYMVASSVAAVAATIGGEKTLTVDAELEAITVDVEAADMSHHTVDVWDFGMEVLENTDLVTYNNNLTVAHVMAWYEGLINAETGEPYKAGDVVPSNVLGWDKDGVKRVLDAGDGLRLDGEQSKANKWRHRGVQTLDSIPNERNESSLADEYGVPYQGIMYSNAQTTAGEEPFTWFELDVTAGDIVWAVVSSNGTDSIITWEAPSGDKQTFTFTRASRTKLQNTCKFYAAETGTYRFYSANEKIVLARLFRETPNKATVSGSVTVPEGKDMTGVSIVFTNTTTGEKTLAPIVDNAYTVQLSEQYSYSLSLDGINDVIVGLTNGFKLKNEQATLTYDVDLVSVELVDVSGSLADLTAETAANLELTFSSDMIYVPAATIDAATQTYTAKFEKGVTYTVSEAGVNDYALDTTSVSATESGAVVNLKFTKKPVYAINVTLEGPSAEEAANVALTFTNINEEGYVYSFRGLENVALRDGQYAVKAVLGGYIQKVTSDVKVNGAAVNKTITMVSNAKPEAVPYKETITVGATDCDFTTINDALDYVRLMGERTAEQRVTIAIEPGDYQEMLVVDVPYVTLKNTSENASIVTKNKGVDIDESSVRITSYYGHGYTYYSMGEDYKYDADVLAANQENGYHSVVNPGSGTGTFWNATVEIQADGFRAEGIIFENSFNQYVSELAAQDTIVPQGGAKGEANGARDTLEAGDTRIQSKSYVERAAALAIGNNFKEIFFDNCSFIGRQDTLYGGTDSTVAFYDCDVYGGTDYIFGGMIAVFAKCDLVLNTDGVDKNDVAYITAAQQKSGRGYLMYNCNVVGVQPGVNSAAEKVSQPGYFGRPWEATTSEATFFYTVVGTANDGTSLIAPAGWNDGLGGKAKAYEYGTYELTADTDNSAKRVDWSNVLEEPVLPDGTIITVPKYLGAWKAFEDKDMSIVIPGQDPIAEPTDPADDALWEEQPGDAPSGTTTYVFDATTLTASADKEAVADGEKLDKDGYFVNKGEGSVKRWSSDKGVTSLEIAKAAGSWVEFTVVGTADAVFSVASTGSSNESAVALLDANGNVVANKEGLTVVKGSSPATTLTYEGLAAGTYKFVSPLDADRNRGVRVINITLTDEVAASAQPTEFKFDATTLTASADKEAVADGEKLDKDGYFVNKGEGSVKRWSSDKGVTSLEIAKAAGSWVEFTVSGTAEAVFAVASTGSSNESAVALLDANGNVVANEEGLSIIKGSSPATTLTYNLTAGTYKLVSPADADRNRGLRVITIDLVETPSLEPVEYTFDATTLTASADKEAVADGEKLGTDGYFVNRGEGSVKRWSSDKGVTSLELAKAAGSAIEFTASGTADAVFSVASTGSSNESAVALLDANGNVVANKEGLSVVKGSSPQTTLTYEGLAAGTYKFVSPTDADRNRGVRVHTITVVDTPAGAAKPPRAEWDTVEAPEITNVALDSENSGKIVVTVKAFVGYDGADQVVVEMIDEMGDVVASGKSAKEDATEHNIEFTPSESGKYTFIATLSREDEEDKVSAESDEFEFKLPLSAPVIKSVTNKGLKDGKGTLEVAWTAVTEARKYKVTVTKEVVVEEGTGDGDDATTDGNDAKATETKVVKTLETTAQKVLIDGLDVGDFVTVSVVAVGVNGESKAAIANATVKDETERTWAFSAYGSSTNLSNNGYVTNKDGSVTVYSEGGKGKVVPGSTDGLAYYYTTIDPSTENFTMTVDVHVDSWKLSNGQEGFGIMVADAVGESGDGTAFWNNSYQLLASKIEYNWDTVNGQVTTATAGENGVIKHSGKLGFGWIAKTGVTATDVAQITAGELSMPGAFSTTSSTLETSAATLNPAGGEFNIVGNGEGAKNTISEITDFKMQIQRNNDGYILRYLDKDGNVLDEKLFYDDNRNNLTQINKKDIHIGFFASRNARATFSNLELTTIHPDEDAPASPKEITYVDPSYQILSSETSNSEDYNFVFYGNADGKLTILNDAGEAVAQDVDYTAKKKYTVKTKLHENDNNFTWVFTPAKGYAPGENQQMKNYDKVESTFKVWYRSFAQDTIYVAPNGSQTAAGTADAPTDIYTAVAYAKAGQKIYLAGGKYELNNVLIDRGHDGTADAPIYLMADPAATERPVLDFSAQTGGASAIILAANYWYLKGFDVTNSLNSQKGLQVSGSYNVVEDVDAYRNGNTGIQISRYLGTDSYDEWPAYNTILNCTSYLNADAGYEDADGFAAKLTVADGNKFVGCIAAYNADDGWDLFAKVQSGSIGAVTIENSLAFKNGYMLGDDKGNTNPGDDVIDPYMEGAKEFSAGNGNGFKMGGDSMSGHHVIKNSIAFANKAKGIDSNSCPDIEVYNCTSFDNESYNVALYTNTAVNTDYVAQGVLSLKSKAGISEQLKPVGAQNLSKIYSDSNYYFDGTKSTNASGAEATLAWFKNTNTEAAIKGGITRDANGSINMGGYLELTDAAAADTGARLGNTSADVVIETVAEVSVFAANVKTLKEVALPEELVAEGYAWKYPETATAVFSGTTTEFIASAADKADKAVIVNFVEFTGLDVFATEQYLFEGDVVSVIAMPVLTPAVDPSDIAGISEAGFSFMIEEKDKLDLVTVSPEGANFMDVSRDENSKDGIAKFTATVTAKLGGKTVKKTGSVEFTTRKAAAYIDYSVEDKDNVIEQSPVSVDVAKADVLKLTATAVGLSKPDVKVAVNDTKVVKYDSKAGTLTAVGEGTATVTMTASADKKVIAKMVVNVAGADLKTNVATMTLDRAKLAGVQFTAMAMNGNDLVADSVVVKSVKKGSKDFAANLVVEKVVGNIYTISTIENDTLAKGNYTLVLAGKLASAPEVEVEFEPVTLKVTETKPTVSNKQTKKVNLFYTAGSVSNTGTLKSTSKLAGVTLTQTDVDKADYKLAASKSGYNIVLKSNAAKAGKNKKITAVASFDGYKARYNKNVTINVATENKAPKLKLEVDNKVLYTQLGIKDTVIRILDTTTNTYVTGADVALATSKKAYVNANKNFALAMDGSDYVLTADKSGSAKISVQDADWTKEIIISQAITVNKNKPKVTVGKLALNNNAQFVGKEQTSAVMTVKNALDYKVKNLVLEGTNAKSKAVVDSLVYSVSVDDKGQNMLNVSFKDGAAVKAGSYSFKATFDLNKLTGMTANVKLTVVAKTTATVKQSGKIDLVNRLGSSVTLKPTLKNLNGTIVGIVLDDDASNLFNVEWDSAKGAAVVTAKEGIDLKKGAKYKVTPSLVVETNGGNVTVPVKSINIVPKQSALKTTKLDVFETRLSATNVAARATFKATSPAKAEILDMVQVNNLENFAVTYDCESDTIAVKIVDAAGLKANKTYKIKMELVAEGAGVNAKPQTVTVSVKVVK